ncbi:25878_t:CDS:2, partial [Gigaspora margarita]
TLERPKDLAQTGKVRIFARSKMLNTGIFPEGRSRDRTELLELKVGVTNIIISAMAANPSQDIKIIPCGLNYFHAHQFHPHVIVKFGSSISIPLELVEKYNNN